MYELMQIEIAGKSELSLKHVSDDNTVSWIPIDDNNTDYLTFKAWGLSGGVVKRTTLDPSLVLRQMTPLDVIKLFTRQENLAIVTATMTIPEAKMWYDRLLAATYITIDDPDTAEGLEIMVQAGLLTAPRKLAILEAIGNGVTQ